MPPWNRTLIERLAAQGQLLAVGMLGLVVLMPFVMLPAFIALLVTIMVVGPRNLIELALPRRRRRNVANDMNPDD